VTYTVNCPDHFTVNCLDENGEEEETEGRGEWKKTFKVETGKPLKVSVYNNSEKQVSITIYVDGKPYKKTESSSSVVTLSGKAGEEPPASMHGQGRVITYSVNGCKDSAIVYINDAGEKEEVKHINGSWKKTVRAETGKPLYLSIWTAWNGVSQQDKQKVRAEIYVDGKLYKNKESQGKTLVIEGKVE
jgi:hypothetical protein